MEAVEHEERPAPIKAAPRGTRAPRLRPHQHDQLRDAKLDLGAFYRVETDESLILQQFFDERFGGWLSEKLTPEKPEKKGRR